MSIRWRCPLTYGKHWCAVVRDDIPYISADRIDVGGPYNLMTYVFEYSLELQRVMSNTEVPFTCDGRVLVVPGVSPQFKDDLAQIVDFKITAEFPTYAR